MPHRNFYYEEHYLLFILVTKRRLTARILHSHKYDRTGHNWRLLCKKDVYRFLDWFPFFCRKKLILANRLVLTHWDHALFHYCFCWCWSSIYNQELVWGQGSYPCGFMITYHKFSCACCSASYTLVNPIDTLPLVHIL